jgi:hypothetical protein
MVNGRFKISPGRILPLGVKDAGRTRIAEHSLIGDDQNPHSAKRTNSATCRTDNDHGFIILIIIISIAILLVIIIGCLVLVVVIGWAVIMIMILVELVVVVPHETASTVTDLHHMRVAGRNPFNVFGHGRGRSKKKRWFRYRHIYDMIWMDERKDRYAPIDIIDKPLEDDLLSVPL